MKTFAWLLSVSVLIVTMVVSASAEQTACNADMLNSCPGACVDRCVEDNAFFDENVAACGRLVRDSQSNPAVRDISACVVPGATAGSDFGSCLSKARAIKRKNTGRAELEELLSTAPTTCAATPLALNELYSCLSAETDTIRDLFEPLVNRGYVTADVQDTAIAGQDIAAASKAITPESPICTAPEAQIDSDELMAESLTTQSTILTSEFKAVSSCRKEWEDWSNEASAKCKTTETGACQKGISTVIATMQSNIQPAAAREVEIKGIIDQVGRQLEEISSVILVRTLMCPSQD